MTDASCNFEAIAALDTLVRHDFRQCHFGDQELKLRGRDLSLANLKSVVAETADFTGATLCGANLAEGQFRRGHFVQVNASNHSEQRTRFTYCDLCETNFYGANLTGAEMILVDATEAIFSSAILNYVAFNESNLASADFRSAVMHETDCDECVMQDANLDSATVTHANFRKANMEHVSFNLAIVTNTNFEGAKMGGATMVRTVFVHCRFVGADLRGADLRTSDLRASDLRRADVREANLRGAKMAGTVLVHGNFAGADLREADLQGADLRGADLRGADLRGANMAHMMVNDAKFAGAKMDTFTEMDHTNWLDAVDVPEAALKYFVWSQASPEPSPTYQSPSPSPSPAAAARALASLTGHTAMDVIEGDVPLRDVVAGTDQVAFRYAGQFYAVSRERLLELSDRLSPHNAIVYPCLALDSLSPTNVVKKRPMVKLGATGVPMNYAYVPADRFLAIANDLEHHLYDLEDTGESLVSVVSRPVLKHHTHLVSGSHCQEGQGGQVYRLKRIAQAKTEAKTEAPGPEPPSKRTRVGGRGRSSRGRSSRGRGRGRRTRKHR